MHTRQFPAIVPFPEQMQSLTTEWVGAGQKIGFVPTMGCLHEGHLSLIREARKRANRVVVSIFINPLQFGPSEDLSSYPKTVEKDIALCKQAEVDVVFVPSNRALYPKSFKTTVHGGELTKKYCGKTRPLHFNGVLTVVKILFELIRPTMAFFGEKDYQQLFLIKQMCRDFWMPIDIVAMPIVRETNGLAMSSRNTYLTHEQQEQAACLYQAIVKVQESAKKGHHQTLQLIELARHTVSQTPNLQIDYVHMVDEKTLEPLGDRLSKRARLLIAAYIGTDPRVRLIDNGPVFI